MVRMASNNEVIKILAIDGGGVRGIIPCVFLDHLRKELNKHGNHTPYYKLFHVMAGTSTGSLISLLLTKPPEVLTDEERLSRLLYMYTHDIKEIFPKPKSEFSQGIKQIFRPKYNGKKLKSLLRKTLKNYTLEDALTKLLIPAYDMCSMEPYLFRHGNASTSSMNFFLRDVGLASTAAPTYLPAANIKSLTNGQSFCFVDGGIFCNDPSLCAYSFAKKTFSHGKKYLIVSLGTGKQPISYNCDKVKKWGALGWINPLNHVPLVTAYMNSQVESEDLILDNMSDVVVYRFQVSLNDISSELDDATAKNMDHLKGKAAALILSNKSKIDRLVKVLNAY